MTKVNDVIEITMSIDFIGLPEDLTSIDLNDYNRSYDISYFLKDECICGCSIDNVEPGFWDDIEEYIEENLHRDLENIAEYEILEVNSRDYDYQKAKIKVKALK